jgi:hypothetical protein
MTEQLKNDPSCPIAWGKQINLYNTVEELEKAAETLNGLMPEVRFAFPLAVSAYVKLSSVH